MRETFGPIGIIRAEGVGPEVMSGALQCLEALGEKTGRHFEFVEYAGSAPATEYSETAYADLKNFYGKIRDQRGCILRAAVYAQIVYKLRNDFDLICKPIFFESIPELFEDSLLKTHSLRDFKILLIRENAQGLLFSREELLQRNGERVVQGTFEYRETRVRAFVQFAFEQAFRRRKNLHLFIKGDIWLKLGPLWFDAVDEVRKNYPDVAFDWDHADTGFAGLLKHPRDYDVVVALGLAGDLISDPLATLLYGSHGLVPSANIDPKGLMVFQTVHGTAHAIAGQDKANPLGMIRASAMMLKMFFTLDKEAQMIEDAVRRVLSNGFRTVDMYARERGHMLVGTKKMSQLVSENL